MAAPRYSTHAEEQAARHARMYAVPGRRSAHLSKQSAGILRMLGPRPWEPGHADLQVSGQTVSWSPTYDHRILAQTHAVGFPDRDRLRIERAYGEAGRRRLRPEDAEQWQRYAHGRYARIAGPHTALNVFLEEGMWRWAVVHLNDRHEPDAVFAHGESSTRTAAQEKALLAVEISRDEEGVIREGGYHEEGALLAGGPFRRRSRLRGRAARAAAKGF